MILLAPVLFAQTTFPPHGLHSNPSRVHAFTNCHLVISPGEVIDDGVLIIRNGLIENAGRNLKVPADAALHDLKGAWVYPGLIDIYAGYGVKKKSRKPGGDSGPQYKGTRSGPVAWNDAVKPEHRVFEELEHSPKSAGQWRKLGFTTVHAVPNDGIFRGQAALLNLGDGSLTEDLIQAETFPCLSFRKGVSRQEYPSSQMGSIALMRQTFLDAAWYQQVMEVKEKLPNTPSIETNQALAKLVELGKDQPFFFDCQDHQDLFRAAKIAEEFGLKTIYKAAGDEYQRMADLEKWKPTLIVPLKFPDAYDLSDPVAAQEVGLQKLMHWEQAPLNPGRLAESKIPFALTTADLKKPASEFWGALYKAIQHGLSPEDALAALTTRPAEILGLSKRIGTLEPGKLANFIIASEPLFEGPKPHLFETWVGGKQFAHEAIPELDLRGKWQMSTGAGSYELWISGLLHQPKLKLIAGTDTLSGKIQVENLNVTLLIPESKSPKAGKLQLIGIYNEGNITGPGSKPDGTTIVWTASRSGDLDAEYLEKEKEEREKKKEQQEVDLAGIPGLVYPFGPYGNAEVPQLEAVLIKNVTVWTNTDQGKMEGVDVLIQNGKIAGVGQGLSGGNGVLEVNGEGKHLTAGIIDEHSHIAISRGVNEGSHANSAEVRIGDVVNATDVNIYRQLSGGVTTSQLLHGSANPIGGQSAIIKLRWGLLPEQMKMETAAPFIKFALGENVKQTNWGDDYRVRYPQTRLGVEQFFRDNFQAALDYRASREAAAQGLGTGLPVRKDLQMETLLEIIDSKRFVTCHSYVQSEITMLMRVAEAFDFRINTFTHVLEGYKIADKLAAHGATGSTFSDWWAYKYEVIDAIPYNATLMAENKVNVCINSDDAEMGRRLNQEAAKAVKYGGLSEEEALKMVTLNPAKALRIDDKVGSVAVGKDADVVLWSDHPLSIYAAAEITWVDGRRYFDRKKDVEIREKIASERLRLTKKMMEKGKGSGKAPAKKGKKLYHCDTYETDYNHE